jgi:type VI protein secretion system component Hcp
MRVFVSALAVTLCAISGVGTAAAQITISTGTINCGAGNVSSLPVLSWSFSGTNPVTAGKPSGKASLANLTVMRAVDGCSAEFIRLLVSGASTPTVTLIQKAIDNGKTYNLITVTLTDAFVANYAISSTGPDETIQFAYSKVCVATVDYFNTGALAAPETVCYNLNDNVVSSN